MDVSSARLENAIAIAHGMARLIKNARPPKHAPDRPRYLLYLTMAESYEAALILIRSAMPSHAASHVRSMVEALVTMTMLANDATYVNQMVYDKLHGEKKFYTELLENVELDDAARAYLKGRLDECIPEYQRLHDLGFRKTVISKLFSETKLTHLSAPYGVLCGFSHNDLAVLAVRHQGETATTYKKPIAPEIVHSILSVAVQVIMQATHEAAPLALYPEGLLEPVFKSMNDCWGDFMAEGIDSTSPGSELA
ncbi:hypothetical protein GNZ12_24170 [Paraburkholderia sp. 1N]|uniref:HEPN AbiU2-like domain-containing protein n=1 Tax=Paraburkholderia solitsugae TaxID=2675748 RepID=A0ABX2BWP1_9BURK|nr:DUF5677 domain-containing protein [Paraburkholderia solitsugae]NPT44350.1 hypothetical protein [Paraburkholderia solitsugae]